MAKEEAQTRFPVNFFRALTLQGQGGGLEAQKVVIQSGNAFTENTRGTRCSCQESVFGRWEEQSSASAGKGTQLEAEA